jgi:hypothetical protein
MGKSSHRLEDLDMKTCTALIAFTALVSLTATAFAQDADQPRGGGRGACREDVQKLCAGFERGGGKIRECLTSNMDKLSDGCKAMVEARAKKSQ